MGAPPAATTAGTKDSASVKLSGGNPWVDVGNWPAAPPLTNGLLTVLGDVRLWVGLKNSDDIGANFDLRAEVLKNGTLVAASEQLCLKGITRNPSLAKAVTLSFGAFQTVTFDGSTDVLSLRVATRMGTNGSGASCGGHANAVGRRTYFDAVDRAASLAMRLTDDVTERWVAVSCSLVAPAPNGMSSYVDSDGNWYRLPGVWFGAPQAGTPLTGTAPPPTLKLSAPDLLALLIAVQTLDNSTAGYTTVTGPLVHMTTRQGVLDSAGAPGPKTAVDKWTDGVAAGKRTLTTHNDPAAAVVRKYSCFTPD